MRPNLFILLCLIGLSTSCNFKPVHPSLWKIGKNKKEFQKVLDFYNNPEDSLKLKAAEFLWENMNNHFYYISKNEAETDSFLKNIENNIFIDYPENTRLYSVLRNKLINRAISKGLADGSLSKPKYQKRSDSKTIKAGFLIENIEYAFKAWDFPWSRHYSFDEFCKYILPYRYGNEVPEPWRKEIFEQFKWVADSVKNPNDPIEIASLLNKQFVQALSYTSILTKNGFELNISNELAARIFGNCHEQAGLGVCVLRSLGIAATVVNIPQWGHFPSGHEVVGMLDLKGEWHPFNLAESGPDVDLNIHPPKMFFKRFDNMAHFQPVLEDASDKLMKTVDLEVKVDANSTDEIFLCVFGRSDWIPIFKGKNKKTTVVFEDVGYRSKMYLAAIKSKGKMKAVSDIFLTDTLGNTTYYKPDISKQTSVTLSRKYPGLKKNMPRITSLIGGEFSVADQKDFQNKKQLYKIDTTLNYYHNIVKCSVQKGRYFRYDFPQALDSIFDGPAEIAFYTTNNNSLQKIEGEYFGSPQLSPEHIELLTDDDVLTYVEVWDCEKDLETETGNIVLRKDNQAIWIGLKSDTTITVTHVGICPRNDKNGIYAGMKYELLYWDKSWISLGVQVATDHFVEFDGVPENAVFWLKNLDEGKEERIFVLENGEQIWW